MDNFQEFIYLRTYSRFLWEESRREKWGETVERLCSFLFNETPNCEAIPEKTKTRIRNHVTNLEVLPSMRLLWSAGENCRRDNISAYNCSALAADSPEVFGESMYLLLSGCGVGYSVEDRYVAKLPKVKYQRSLPLVKYIIDDSRAGWKDAINFGVDLWLNGRDIEFNYAKLRPAGSPLRISGGYSSGPDPLRQALNFMRQTILGAQGRNLISLEVSDMFNEIASAVVCGGVRRSSQICLSDPDDIDLRDSKQSGYIQRRAMANISAVYRKQPEVLDFAEEFINMARTASGERGIFNLYSARKHSPKRRDKSQIRLTNPCGETLLRNRGLCNLTEVVVRATDDFETVREKIRTATWLGTLQSTLNYFPELNPEWAKNCEEERLLGVSLTGMCDNVSLITPETLKHWKQAAIKTAKEASTALKINMPAAITCIKPSGTVSQLVNSSAGLHTRYAPYYIRRVRISEHDPLFTLMADQGVPWEKDYISDATNVLEFPVAAPEGALCREHTSAIEQLEWYKMINENWCEHSAQSAPSRLKNMNGWT